jgi:hypothetical protein
MLTNFFTYAPAPSIIGLVAVLLWLGTKFKNTQAWCSRDPLKYIAITALCVTAWQFYKNPYSKSTLCGWMFISDYSGSSNAPSNQAPRARPVSYPSNGYYQ